VRLPTTFSERVTRAAQRLIKAIGVTQDALAIYRGYSAMDLKSFAAKIEEITRRKFEHGRESAMTLWTLDAAGKRRFFNVEMRDSSFEAKYAAAHQLRDFVKDNEPVAYALVSEGWGGANREEILFILVVTRDVTKHGVSRIHRLCGRGTGRF
jgi:hypothetical protein